MKLKSSPIQPLMQGVEYHPVTPLRLKDLAEFSEQHGRFRYCSCMRWRLKSSDYKQSTKETRIAGLESLVGCGVPIGILAYSDNVPIGWCSVAPRETFEAVERYQKLRPIDDESVWSVTCFFVDSQFRHQGISSGLLVAAVDYCRTQGAGIIEGYPVAKGSKLYSYMGTPEIFLQAGFSNVTPAGRERQIMRQTL